MRLCPVRRLLLRQYLRFKTIVHSAQAWPLLSRGSIISRQHLRRWSDLLNEHAPLAYPTSVIRTMPRFNTTASVDELSLLRTSCRNVGYFAALER